MLDKYQCQHEILLFAGYCKNLHLPQHMVRDRITGSLIGWSPSPDTVVDSIIGYVPELTDIEGARDESTDDDVDTIDHVG